MNMATDSIKNGAGHPQCTSELEIAVQVTGLKQTENQPQSLKLKHSNNSYDPTSNKEENKKTNVPSTLFKWHEKAYLCGSTTLVLSIATKDKPIELVLTESFSNTGSNMNIDGYYLENRLYAIAPFTNMALIQNGNRTTNAKSMDLTQNLLPVRTGYIYIFNHGKLWRELLSSQDEQGNNQFEDINVESYRNTDGSYKLEHREPAGLPLKDIWLPGAFANNSPIELQLMYSDVPLSAERITFLENNAKDRSKRTTTFKWDTSLTQKHGSIAQGLRKAGQHKLGAFPVISAYFPKPTRGRDELTERQFDNPVKYLTKTEYTQNVYKNSTHPDPIRSDNPYVKVESGAILYNILKQKKTLNVKEQKKMEVLTETWAAPLPFVNCLPALTERGIWAFLVEDANYIISHRLDRFDDITLLFTTLAEKASTEPYHKLARFIEKQRNVQIINEGVQRFAGTGKERYEKATSQPERECLYKILGFFKTTMLRTFKELPMDQVLADMLSNWLNKFDLAGHFSYLVRVLNMMSCSNDKIDPLGCNNQDIKKDYNNSPDKFVLDILTDATNNISKMLWPIVKPEEIEKEFEDYPETPNKGDGLFNPTIWQNIVKEDALKNNKPSVYNGLTFIATHHYAQTPGADWKRVTVSSLWAILGELESTIERVKKTKVTNDAKMLTLNQELVEVEGKYNALYGKLTQQAITHEELSSQLASLEKEITTKKRLIVELTEELEQLFESSSLIKLKIHLGTAQLTRLFSAGYLKQMVWKLLSTIPLNGKLEGNWRILGLVDPQLAGNKPVLEANKGKVITDQGESVKIQPNKQGGAQVRYFAALPENHPHVIRSDQIKGQLIPELEAGLQADINNQHVVKGQLAELLPEEQQVKQQTQTAKTEVANAKQQLNDNRLSLITRGQVNNLSAMERLKSGYQKVASSGIMPPILLAFEVYNLTNVWSAYNKTANDRSELRAVTDRLSSLFGVSIAFVAVVEQLQISYYAVNQLGEPPIRAFLNKEIMLISKYDFLLKVRALPIGLLAIVGIGLSVSDIVVGIARKDQGMVVGAVFGLAGGLASLVSIALGESVVFLGLGPIGWMLMALGLTLAGVFIAFKFGDTPLEKWFHQGPFSSYQHTLLEPEIKAFSALLNILFPPSITVMNNPFKQEALAAVKALRSKGIAEDDEAFKEAYAMAEANTCISIACNLRAILKQSCIIKFEAKAYKHTLTTDITTQRSEEEQGKNRIEIQSSSTLAASSAAKILTSQKASSGLLIFAYTPPDTKLPRQAPDLKRGFEIFQEGYHHHSSLDAYLWFIAVQLQVRIVLDNNKEVLVVPAPSFEENKTYDSKADGEPRFIASNVRLNGSPQAAFQQDFWLKEIYSTRSIIQ